MKLASHLSDDPGFADLLNYAYLIEDGVLLNKDGAFLVTYQFIGPDLESASGAEWDALTASFNRLVTGLDDGWMLHVDDVRMPVATYPEPGHFPDAVSALIDTERRHYYTHPTSHYSNAQFLTFVWKFPLPVVKATRHWFVDGLPEGHDDANLSMLLAQFQERVQRCVGLISSYGRFTPLNSAALLRYLHTCISGTHVPIAVPPAQGLVDAVLARHPVTGGYVPRVGSAAVTVLSLLGYVNQTTLPGLLEAVGTYPLPYRWSNRFIPLSLETAAREIKRYQRHWHNQVKGFSGILHETIFGSSTPKIDGNAQHLYEQTTEALTLNSQHSTRWGYWTSSVVFIHDDSTVVNAAVTAITRYVEQCGFAVLREDCHAFDAWLGTIPGHGSCHVRRLFVNGWQLAHALPLGSRWTGDAVSDPASLLPPHSPPVFYAQTTGKTPFRFHLDVGDVGHHLVCGPTGSGKSTYLGFLIAQFLRYPHAHIFVFDKDESHKALTHALGGGHVDLGDTESLAFCPLADLTIDRQKARAGQFIEDLVSLQHVVLTPENRTAIYRALESLAHDTHHRNLTVFQAAVQDETVRQALQYYTIDGPLKSLDAHHESCPWGPLQTFEMQGLLSQKPLVVLPILRTLFDCVFH